MKPLVIFGTGRLADLVFNLLGNKSNSVKAFTLDREYIDARTHFSKVVIPYDEVMNRYPPDEFNMFCAVGYKDMRMRKSIYERIKNDGYKLINIIGEKISSTNEMILGDNNLIFNGAYIGSNGIIGNNNIMRPMMYLGHLHNVGDHNYFAPGCNIGGNCSIGNLNFIGIGSTILDSKKIGNEVLVAGGSVVVKDCKDFTLYAGNPANEKRNHKQTGIIIK